MHLNHSDKNTKWDGKDILKKKTIEPGAEGRREDGSWEGETETSAYREEKVPIVDRRPPSLTNTVKGGRKGL